MIRVRVPATSANVGAGFDALGLAVGLYNTATFELRPQGLEIAATDGTQVPTGRSNLIYRAVRTVFDQVGEKLPGLRILQTNAIPMARGLGSSSACIVAGILGADALLGHKLTRRQMLTLATAIEGHPDNVAPAMLGGFVTSAYDEGQVYSVKKEISKNLAFAAFVPSFGLLTEKARAALATAAFCDGDYELLEVATKDALHQQYRLPLIPGGEKVFDLARRLDAYAVYISGAGPTIMAVVHKDNEIFFEKAQRELAGDPELAAFSLHRYEADNIGAVLE